MSQGVVAALLGVFVLMALVAMFATLPGTAELEWIGMTVRPLSAEEAMARGIPRGRGGLFVEGVEGIAARAGVREGDVLLGVNGSPVRDLNSFSHIVDKTDFFGKGVTLGLAREGTLGGLTIRGNAPAGPAAALPGGPHQDGPAPAPAGPIQPTGVIGRKWLGVEAETFSVGEGRELGIPAGIRGVLIDGVAANSRAERAGLLPNDVIVSVNGQKIGTTADLWGILGALSVTDSLEFCLYREGRFTSVLLPGEPGARAAGFSPGPVAQGWGAGGQLVCPGCGTTVMQPPGTARCRLPCPKCGAWMCWRQW